MTVRRHDIKVAIAGRPDETEKNLSSERVAARFSGLLRRDLREAQSFQVTVRTHAGRRLRVSKPGTRHLDSTDRSVVEALLPENYEIVG